MLLRFISEVDKLIAFQLSIPTITDNVEKNTVSESLDSLGEPTRCAPYLF